MKLAFALVLGVSMIFLAAFSATAAPNPTSSIYRCHDGRWFSVDRNHQNAFIRYADERYNLSRRPSSLGTKYASAEATLIVDGQLAVFVTQKLFDLDQCYLAK